MNSTPYNIVGKYRDEMMGFAVLWICAYHSNFQFPDNILFSPINFFCSVGYGGVDIFLFLSGFGLMHGIKKNPSTLLFYYKRFLRIIPSYWLVLLTVFICTIILGNKISFKLQFFYFSTIGFWLQYHNQYWFISAIIVFYLFFPLFFNIYYRARNKILIIIWISTISILFSLYTIQFPLGFIKLFIDRIPIFFIGAHIGNLSLINCNKLVKYRNQIHCLSLIFGSSILIISYLSLSSEDMFKYGLYFYPFIFIVPPVCLFLAFAFENMGYNHKKIKRLLVFCGKRSIEIFLISATIPYNFPNNPIATFFEKSHNIKYLIYFFLTVMLSIPLKKISVIIQKNAILAIK